MKTRLTLLELLLLPLALLAGAAAQPTETDDVQTGFLFRSIDVGATEYKYSVYVPREYAKRRQESWPFILFLHGRGESGTDGQRQMLIGLTPRLIDKAERWPFIVLMPQKPDGESQWEDHFAAVQQMFDRTLTEYNIDESRLYLTGLSQGGHGTWIYNALMPRRFAAIAPVCGYSEPSDGYRRTDAGSPQTKQIIEAAARGGGAVWAFHGEADGVVPASQTTFLVERIRAGGGDVKVTLYPGVGHDSWNPAYAEEELPRWFLSHRRKD